MRVMSVLAVAVILLSGCSEEGAGSGAEGTDATDTTDDSGAGNATTEPGSTTTGSGNGTAGTPTGNTTGAAGNGTAGNVTGNATDNTTVVPTVGAETYFLHAEGTDADQTYMDHVPADAREAGSHTALVAQPVNGGYDYTFPSTEATTNIHPEASGVELLFYGWTIAPHPAVTVTGTLAGDGGNVGSGTSDAQVVATLYTGGAVAALMECVEFRVTFGAAREIAAGESLSLRVQSDYPVNFFPCFEGGTETSRLNLGA